MNVNSLTGIGDKLSVSTMVSSGMGTKSGTIDYTAPLKNNGLTFGVGASRSEYALGDIYSSLNATGTTSAVYGKLSFPLIASSSESLSVSFMPQLQNIKDEQAGSSNPRKAYLATFGADYVKSTTFLSVPSTLDAKLNYTNGRLMFEDATLESSDASGTNTQGGFSKLDCSVTITSMINSSVTLKNILNTQFALANKNLDPSQYITIGGSNAVRAFPVTQESSSSGYVYTAELSRVLPNYDTYSQSAYLFYDAGRAFNANTSVVSYSSSTLQDAGVGYRITKDKMFGKLELAHIIGGTEVSGMPHYSTKALFQVGTGW